MQVLNDAVAVVLFRTFVELRKEQITPSLMALAFGKFVLLAVGSVFVGTAFGLLSAFIFKHLQLRAFPSLEFSLVCIFAYFPYLLAEGWGLSGIMSILFCGITMAHYTHSNLSLVTQITAQQAFRMFAFLSETFVFVYLGLAVFTFDHMWHIGLIMVCILLCLVGRALNIYPLSAIVNRYRSVQIDRKMQFIMFFSGLRGAIAFALALNVPSSHSNLMVTTTLAVVLFTIIVFGGGTLPLLSILNVQGDAMAFSEKVQMSKTAELGRPVPNREVLTNRTHSAGNDDDNWFERVDAEYLRPFFCLDPHRAVHLHADEDLLHEDEEALEGHTVHGQDPKQTRAAQELIRMTSGAPSGGSFMRLGASELHVVNGSLGEDDI